MAILVDNKLLFIHIQKNAGTSISFWLHKYADGRKVGGKHIHLNRLLREQRWNFSRDMYNFSFAVVRNPFSKTVSAYKYLKKKLIKEIVKQILQCRFLVLKSGLLLSTKLDINGYGCLKKNISNNVI